MRVNLEFPNIDKDLKKDIINIRNSVILHAINLPISTNLDSCEKFHKPRRANSTQKKIENNEGKDPLLYSTIYEHQEYEVKLGKPGKEFFRRGERKNEYDTFPSIFKNNICYVNSPDSFINIFEYLTNIKDDDALELLGALIYRNTHLLDHKIDEKKMFSYKPYKEIIEEIEISNQNELPIIIFLYFIELISLNEDIKYFYWKKIGFQSGRINNLSTYCNFILFRLNKIEDFNIIGQAVVRNVLPLSIKKAKHLFKYL